MMLRHAESSLVFRDTEDVTVFRFRRPSPESVISFRSFRWRVNSVQDSNNFVHGPGVHAAPLVGRHHTVLHQLPGGFPKQFKEKSLEKWLTADVAANVFRISVAHFGSSLRAEMC